MSTICRSVQARTRSHPRNSKHSSKAPIRTGKKRKSTPAQPHTFLTEVLCPVASSSSTRNSMSPTPTPPQRPYSGSVQTADDSAEVHLILGNETLKTDASSIVRVLGEYQKAMYDWQELAEINRREAEGWRWLVELDGREEGDCWINEGGNSIGEEKEIPKLGRQYGYGGTPEAREYRDNWFDVLQDRLSFQERCIDGLKLETKGLRDQVFRLESLVRGFRRGEPDLGLSSASDPHSLPSTDIAKDHVGTGIKGLYFTPSKSYIVEETEENDAAFVYELFPGLTPLQELADIDGCSDSDPDFDGSPASPKLIPVPRDEPTTFEEVAPTNHLGLEDDDESEIDGQYLSTPTTISEWSPSVTLETASLASTPTPSHDSDREDTPMPIYHSTPSPDCPHSGIIEPFPKSDCHTSNQFLSRPRLEGFGVWAKSALELIDIKGKKSDEEGLEQKLNRLEWTWDLIRGFEHNLVETQFG